MIRVFRVFVVIVLAAFTLAPRAAFAHGGTDVSVKGDVRPDGPVEIVGANFAPNDAVRIELRRESTQTVELGRILADADGNFTQTLHVPASVAPGLYQLAAQGQESATAEVTVLKPAAGTAAAPPPGASSATVENQRPTRETVVLAVFTALVALMAVGLLWVSRTHARAAADRSERDIT